MNRSQFRYQPDEWAHDLDQWWIPLASLVTGADCGSEAWPTVLGVEDFFDHRLLEQARVLTPWICLAATAVAARAARDWAESATPHDRRTEARAARWALATTAFDLAVWWQALRWNGVEFGTGPISTEELINTGRDALVARGHPAVHDNLPVAICLVAGWLAHSRGAVLAPRRAQGPPPERLWDGEPAADQAIAEIAGSVAGSDSLAWGTAHLAERLLGGTLDRRPQLPRPDDPPDEAQANVLLAAGHGQVGLVEARRHHSRLAAGAGLVVPDLARMAFVHGTADFLDSIAAAFAAAAKAGPLERPGELISWNIQLSGGAHPLAERTVSASRLDWARTWPSGRSAISAYSPTKTWRSPARFPRTAVSVKSRGPARRSKPLITAGSASSCIQRARPGATRTSASNSREWKLARTR